MQKEKKETRKLSGKKNSEEEAIKKKIFCVWLKYATTRGNFSFFKL